jgi:hypothetical protein
MSQSNPFPGVNPFLNHFLQQPDGQWHSFHAEYNAELRRRLDRTLPPNYYAALETSLQVAIRAESDAARTSVTTGDVIVWGRGEAGIAALTAPAPMLILPLESLILEAEDEANAVVVYTMRAGKLPGDAVTRFELLSPSNKPGGTHYAQYMHKRMEFLHTGLRLVEIDFLDLSDPIDGRIPNYRDHDPNAQPYTIAVSDPRGSLPERLTWVYGIGVLDAIPTLPIPLNGADRLPVDFGAVYQTVYDSSRLFQDLGERGALPVQFRRYSDADQAAIRAHLAGRTPP